MGDKRSAYKVLVGRPEERRLVGRPRRKLEYNIKMYFSRSGMGKIGLTDLAHDRDRWLALLNAVLNLRAS
jgi:hypothetical protein